MITSELLIKYSGLVHAQPASHVLEINDICTEIVKFMQIQDIIPEVINADDQESFSTIVRSTKFSKELTRKILIHAAMADKLWVISKIAERKGQISDRMIIYKIFVMHGHIQSLVKCTSGLKQMDVYNLQDIAAKNGRLQCLRYLYHKHGSWFNRTHAITLLNLTIQNNHFECFEFIMKTNIVLGPTVITTASEYGRVRYLEVLCPKIGRGYECCSSRALLAAITNGHMNVIKYFEPYLNSWIDPECVEAAITAGNVPMLKFITPHILKQRDFESPINKLQKFAILNGQMECYEYLAGL